MTAVAQPGTGVGDPAVRERLTRIRRAVRAALVVGVAASVAANVLHAAAHPVSQVIAAWPPLALLLTVELIARLPVHRRGLAIVRLAATAAIAGIAAWVSYWHMVGVVARYGETGATPYLLPVSVDGLIIVASISLIELAGRLHHLPADARAEASRPPRPAGAAPGAATADSPSGEVPRQQAAAAPRSRPREKGLVSPSAAASGPPAPTATPASTARHDDIAAQPVIGGHGHPRSSRATKDAVAYWRARDPSLHPAAVAALIGRSERTVRRHWPSSRHASAAA